MLYAHVTCTLFNRYTDPQTRKELWARTVLHGVSWTQRLVSTISETGVRLASICSIRIPAGVEADGKMYVPYCAWAEADKDACWTLHEGDILVQGAPHSPQIHPGKYFGEKALQIQAWGDNRRGGIPHWRVTAT